MEKKLEEMLDTLEEAKVSDSEFPYNQFEHKHFLCMCGHVSPSYKLKGKDELFEYNIELNAEKRAIDKFFANEPGMKVGLPKYPEEYQSINLCIKVNSENLNENHKKALYDYMRKEMAKEGNNFEPSPMEKMDIEEDDYERWNTEEKHGVTYTQKFSPEAWGYLCRKVMKLRELITGTEEAKTTNYGKR